MTIDVEFLKSIPYFAGLSFAELDSIGKLVLEKKADRREIILYEGDPAEGVYFVVSGALKLFKTSAEGKEQILGILRPGDSFNDVPVFDDAPNPASAEAMTPVVLYELNKTDFRAVLEDYPEVVSNTITVLAGQVRQMVSLVEDLSFRHVIGRVARILLDTAGAVTGSDGPGPRLTQQDMAAMAGTAREVVGRSLKSLEDDGIIKFDRHRIMVVDREALRDLVESPV